MPDEAGEDASWLRRASLVVLGRLPHAALSRAFGRLADLPLPGPVRAPAYRLFARAVGARLDEVELPLKDYPSLGAFFVRRLEPGARRWPDVERLACSPADGVMGRSGTVRQGRLIQAKGIDYEMAELLDDPTAAPRFDGGAFLTLYLAPRHYHRIHTPTAGVIACARHVPGSLFPVNTPAVASVPALFARNERLIAYVDGPLGRVAVVAVGAFNVGRITAAFDPDWRTNRRGAAPETRTYEPPRPLARGEEIMAFNLGSTVILLFEPGRVTLSAPARGAEVRVGTVVAIG